MSAGNRDLILSHINDFWPSNHKDFFEWTLGPVQEILPNLRVCRIRPISPDEPWVYVSVGVSEVMHGGCNRVEFFLLAPAENPRHVETIAVLANAHARGDHVLQVGCAVNMGRGWLEGSKADHFLMSLPYPYGPRLEICKDADRGAIQFIWALPITEAERRFMLEEGMEELEQRFDAAAIDAIDPHRESVV